MNYSRGKFFKNKKSKYTSNKYQWKRIFFLEVLLELLIIQIVGCAKYFLQGRNY